MEQDVELFNRECLAWYVIYSLMIEKAAGQDILCKVQSSFSGSRDT
jgi:hypothetical protein